MILLIYELAFGFLEGFAQALSPRLIDSFGSALFVSTCHDLFFVAIVVYLSKRILGVDVFRSIKINDNRIGSILTWVAIGLVAFLVAEQILVNCAPFFPSDTDDGNELVEMLAKADSWSEYASVVCLFGVLGPFVEEVFFRGLCYRLLRSQHGVVSAIAVVTLIFVLFHPILSWVPHLVFASVILCLAFEVGGSLSYPVIVHIVINLSSISKALLWP